MLIPMEVIGVRVEMPSNQPIVLLKEIDGSRFLPIWVGAVEATAIAFAQQGVEPPRPLTHDLMNNLVELLDATLTAVHMTEIKDGMAKCKIELKQDEWDLFYKTIDANSDGVLTCEEWVEILEPKVTAQNDYAKLLGGINI